jgi:hypothetical protein
VKTQREREEWSADFLSLELLSDRAKAEAVVGDCSMV